MPRMEWCHLVMKSILFTGYLRLQPGLLSAGWFTVPAEWEIILLQSENRAPAVPSRAGRNRKWSTHSLGKRKWRQNESLKDGTWGPKPSWVESPVPRSRITFTWCLGKQRGSVMMKSACCVPGLISHFIDYFKLSLLFSCTRAVASLEVIDPRKPWENTLVCAQAASWTCADPEFHTVFSQGLAGHDNPNWSAQCTSIWVMLYCYILLLFFSHGDFLMA